MNELVQHIKVLLLTHNHVALPQFGTFFTDRAKACRIEEDVFTPVRCSLYFVSEIDDTDKSLVKSFMQTHKLSEEQAEKHVDKLVADAGRILATTGILDFDILGTFNFNGGRISFSPCTAGLIVPAFYGLDAVGMPLLPMLTSDQNKKEHASDTKEEPSSSSYVIKLNRSVVHYAASIAAAILVFFVFNTPLGHDKGFVSYKADLTGMLVPYVTNIDLDGMEYEAAATNNMIQDDSDMSDGEGNVQVQEEDNLSVKDEPATIEAPISKTRYTIVLASNVSEKGANNYVDKLQSSGYNEARIIDNGKMIRVVYGAFDSEEQARAKSRELKEKDSQFSSVWILSTND